MTQRARNTAPSVSSIHALCLDGWEARIALATPHLLGSLSAVLGDFAPREVPALAVPVQRRAPALETSTR